LLVALAWIAPAQDLAGDARSRPTRLLDEGYVGSEACRACHVKNHESWSASYHSRMTQVASPGAVLAPFEGRTSTLDGVAWELSRAGERFFARPASAAGLALGEPSEVVLTTGSHHYQIYWLAVRDAAGMTALPLVWHVGDARWVPRRSMFLLPPGRVTAEETGRWQRICIKCHATNGTQSHASDGTTRVAELGIACEACHGPGALHVQRHGEDGPDPRRSLDPDPTIVDPSALPHERSAQVCGQCHGIHPFRSQQERERWEVDGFAYRPGDDLGATRELLRGDRAQNSPELRARIDHAAGALAELYWPDGEVRVSGREYNGLVESPCFQRGTLACVSCHEMHPTSGAVRTLAEWADDQLTLGMDGPAACLSCHAQFGEAAALEAHTHHGARSSGSDCLNCHMPRTTYGLTKAMRSHTIKSPSIASALAAGRPLACNLCHLDRPLGWSADRLHEWYGHERPPLEPEREGVAEALLGALQGDAGVRALVAWHLGWPSARAAAGTGWMPPLLSTLLMDEYDAVRWIAMHSARLDERYRSLALDFSAPIEEQRNVVRETVLADWLRAGLQAAPDRREALLIGPDGQLDQARFRALFARRDRRDVMLGE
jgi:hypothetical protein